MSKNRTKTPMKRAPAQVVCEGFYDFQLLVIFFGYLSHIE